MQISAPTHTHTQGNKEKEKEKRCSFLSLFVYRFRQWVHQRVLLDISIQPMWYPPASHYVYGVIYIKRMQLVFGYSFPLYLVILNLHVVEEFWRQIYKEHAHIKCSMYCNSRELLYSPKLSAHDQALKIFFFFFFSVDLTINKKVLNNFLS